VTTFESTTGAVELVDFMPPGDGGANLVRIVRGIRGRVSLRTEFILRFDYGSVVPWVEHLPDEGLRAIAGPEMVVLHTPVPLHGRDFISVGEVRTSALARMCRLSCATALPICRRRKEFIPTAHCAKRKFWGGLQWHSESGGLGRNISLKSPFYRKGGPIGFPQHL
jgi:hypothetical protein